MQNLNGPEAQKIKKLFGGIASSYDKANDVITLGMAKSWRKKLVKLSGVTAGMSVLDCATGTGDLAIDFKKVVGSKGKVIGSDFCQEMLDFAPQKAKAKNLEINFKLEDVTQMSFPDQTFDVTSIAYGIRNVNNPSLGLSEMARVTKTGGSVMVLETGAIETPILKHIIPLYFNYVVPVLGGLVSGDKDAYNYLNKSSGQFPCKQKFVDVMHSTGCFSHVEFKSILGGASYIYKGTVA